MFGEVVVMNVRLVKSVVAVAIGVLLSVQVVSAKDGVDKSGELMFKAGAGAAMCSIKFDQQVDGVVSSSTLFDVAVGGEINLSDTEQRKYTSSSTRVKDGFVETGLVLHGRLLSWDEKSGVATLQTEQKISLLQSMDTSTVNGVAIELPNTSEVGGVKNVSLAKGDEIPLIDAEMKRESKGSSGAGRKLDGIKVSLSITLLDCHQSVD